MWDKAVIATLAWFIAIYKFGAMRRDGQWRTGSVTFYFWTFSLCTAIGLTLMSWPMYLAFDRLVGLPNLGWLVTYVAFSLAIYYMSSGCYLVLKQTRPHFMRWSLLLTLVILFAVYALGIVALPEKPDHTVPETLVEVIFMETMYIYMAVLCAIPMITFAGLYRHEAFVSARIRWLVGLATALISTFVLVMKIALTLLAFWDPVTPALAVLYPLISIGVVAVGILFPFSFLPNNLYQTMARPFEFLGKTLAWYELKSLQNRLDPLCPPVVDDSPELKASLKNLDFYLYRVVIAILDAKKTLAGYADITNDLAVMPATMAHMTGIVLPEWDERKLQQARLLHGELQKVDDSQEFSRLVKSYQKVSRVMRWKTWANLSRGGASIDIAYQS
jgi:hypothetical protein